MLLNPTSPPLTPSVLWAAPCVRLHIGRGQAGGVGWGEEVTEALLGQVSILIVVEGLSWQLAEEVGTVHGTNSYTASAQGPLGGCQRLCAAAAAYTTGKWKNTLIIFLLIKKKVDQAVVDAKIDKISHTEASLTTDLLNETCGGLYYFMFIWTHFQLQKVQIWT